MRKHDTISFSPAVPPSVSAIPFEADFFTKGEDIQISFLIDRAFPSVNPSEITWIFDNVELDTSCLDCKARYNFSKGLLSLNITDIQVSDDGPFTLRAGNPAGYDEATINVTVYGECLGGKGGDAFCHWTVSVIFVKWFFAAIFCEVIFCSNFLRSDFCSDFLKVIFLQGDFCSNFCQSNFCAIFFKKISWVIIQQQFFCRMIFCGMILQ